MTDRPMFRAFDCPFEKLPELLVGPTREGYVIASLKVDWKGRDPSRQTMWAWVMLEDLNLRVAQQETLQAAAMERSANSIHVPGRP